LALAGDLFRFKIKRAKRLRPEGVASRLSPHIQRALTTEEDADL